MGSKEILLILLSVIVVTAAIAVGVNLARVSFADQVRDLVIHKVNDIGMRANIYRKKPITQGGGEGSYKGFGDQLNNLLKEDILIDKFRLKEKKNRIDITLTLISEGEKKRPVRVMGRYDEAGMERLRVYDPEEKKWTLIFKRK
jgi:hypothetical protein